MIFQNPQEEVVEEGEVRYICYNNDKKKSMVISIKHINVKATEVRYKRQTEAMKLVYKKEEYMEGGVHPTIDEYYDEMYNGKVNGTYKLRHSGVWDYVKYIRGKDKKVFDFTINHDVAQYESEPYF